MSEKVSFAKDYLEPKLLECICSELTLSNKKWICHGIYRSLSSQNLEVFFNELTDSLYTANEKYENFIVTGDFNIDIGLSYGEHDKLEEFCAIFNLTSLINKETCFTSNHKSIIDLILTNNLISFQNSSIMWGKVFKNGPSKIC